MNNTKIYPITYRGEDKGKWIRSQSVLKFRNEKKASSFLDLRDIHQCERDRKRDLQNCRVKPQPNRFIDLGKIEY